MLFKYSAKFPMPTGHLARAFNEPSAKNRGGIGCLWHIFSCFATPCAHNRNGTCPLQLMALLMVHRANYVNRYAHQMGQGLTAAAATSSAPCAVLLLLSHSGVKAMSICQSKAAVSRILLLPFRGARSVRLANARRAGINTTATSSTADAGTELKEPDSEILAMLVCPFSKAPLTYDPQARELLSPVGVAYPVTANGIPNMVPASARIIAQE